MSDKWRHLPDASVATAVPSGSAEVQGIAFASADAVRSRFGSGRSAGSPTVATDLEKETAPLTRPTMAFTMQSPNDQRMETENCKM